MDSYSCQSGAAPDPDKKVLVFVLFLGVDGPQISGVMSLDGMRHHFDRNVNLRLNYLALIMIL